VITESPPGLLAALAAALAPARATAVLGRAPGPAADEATRLAPLSRSERLDALAVALAALPEPPPRARQLAAAAERPTVAALVRGSETSPPRNVLARLVEERVRALNGCTRFANT
jgi:hypothetical protein